MQNRNDRPPTDAVIADLARYIDQYAVASPLAWQTAQHCLLDSLGCAFEALAHPDCTNLLGPTVAGTTVPHGARVPGTVHVLDPIAAAFDTAALIRWLDYNDAFYGRTVIHPSDCIGALLAAADWSSRTRLARREPPLFMRDVLATMVKAYEVMGALALENAFTTELKLDHVLLVKVGCAGAVTGLLGGTRCEIESAISNAFIDGHALTAFRRKPNAGTRKSWSAADAASRGVWLALLALKGEMGYPSALTAKSWGFYDVLAQGQAFRFQRPLGSYVMENVQFKVSYPAAFHAQTAAEAAIRLHGEVRARLGDIARIELWSHGYGLAILDRSGPLANVADRDHCLQYIAAVGLVHGRLLPTDYEDEVAADPRIDALRGKMAVHEDPRYTRDFTAPDKRSNANAIRVHFRDGTSTGRVEVEFPAGHPRRRSEALPLLMTKFEQGVARVHAGTRCERIVALCSDADRLAATPVHELMDLLAAA